MKNVVAGNENEGETDSEDEEESESESDSNSKSDSESDSEETESSSDERMVTPTQDSLLPLLKSQKSFHLNTQSAFSSFMT